MSRFAILFSALVFGGVGYAADLTISLHDPVGDVVVGIDVVSVKLDFGSTTGAFTITAEADAARPFVGSMVLNVNLYNVDAANRNTPTVGFLLRSNPRSLGVPQTKLIISGVDSKLTFWQSGDRVAYSEVPFGAPTAFVSNAYANCTTSGCAYSDLFGSHAASDFTTVQATLSQNLLVNPRFDGSLTGWKLGSGTSSYDSSRNASGAASGSLKSINSIDQSSNPFCDGVIICVTIFPAEQCIPVTAGTTYAFGSNIFIPSGQSTSGQGALIVSFWTSNDCGGSFAGFGDGSPVTTTGQWVLSSGTFLAPAGATGARIAFANGRVQKTGSFRMNYDDAYFQIAGPVASGNSCPIVDPGVQVPVTNSGYIYSSKYAGPALKFTGTNMGATPVLNPFVLILDYHTGTGSPINFYQGPTTRCFSSTPQAYVPLAAVVMPGNRVSKTAVFRPGNGFYGGLTVTFRRYALSGLQ